MKKEYKTPEVQVVKLKTECALLSGSITEGTGNATEMSGGRFNARRGGRFWDDDEEN